MNDITASLDVRPLDPRQVDLIKQSILRFGWFSGKSRLYVVSHPETRGKFVLIDGNHRLEALRQLFEETKSLEYVSLFILLSFFPPSSILHFSIVRRLSTLVNIQTKGLLLGKSLLCSRQVCFSPPFFLHNF